MNGTIILNILCATTLLILFTDITANAIEVGYIRGPIAEVIREKEYIWGPDDFSGFYYDIDKQIGSEVLHIYITDDNMFKKNTGITYETSCQFKETKSKEWKGYYCIGFLGEEFCAGYFKGSYLSDKSDLKDLLANGLISKVLIDDDKETIIKYKEKILLGEGYSLHFQSVNEQSVAFIKLMKDGELVDSKIIDANDMSGSYYNYNGDDDKKIVTLAIHFKNCFYDPNDINESLLTCNGIFQISDSIIHLNNESFGKMKLISTMDNKISMKLEDDMPIDADSDFPLMGNFWIKTADQKLDSANPLRFYIYMRVENPGFYEIRGEIVPAIDKTYQWSSEEFPGFYYDLDNNIKTEKIELTVTDGFHIEEGNLKYETHTQNNSFKFKDWGNYNVIGFQSKKYFAGYLENSFIYNESDKHNSITKNLIQAGNLSRILIDTDDEYNYKAGDNITLLDKYKLHITLIDIKGNKLYLRLFNGSDSLIDSQVIEPSKKDATIKDKTYYYIHSLNGTSKKLITIAVHFKNAFFSDGQNITCIDGIWQISENVESINPDSVYGIMKISDYTDNNIVMKNQEPIALRKGARTLMDPICLKTVESDLKLFYLSKKLQIEADAGQRASKIEIAIDD